MARQPLQTRPKLHEEVLQGIQAALSKATPVGLSKPAAKKLRETLLGAIGEVEATLAALDPVKEPKNWFDPADSTTAGRLVAAALIAQPRVPMELLQPTYGAGVYAIYYRGDHPAYVAIAGSETPIYVGKADPITRAATSAREQGTKLSSRLAEHRKTIRRVEEYAKTLGLPIGLHPLKITDFECRRLVTATNAQMYAERHLIDMFRPAWNIETKLCWGISMHGDQTARVNDRPPWHVLHPGVGWALRGNIADSRPASQIIADIAQHFERNPPYASADHIIETFLHAFLQDPMVASTPVSDDSVDALADAEQEVEDKIGQSGEH